MLYRKSSPNPPTLLLRIVATAGATAVLAACSGEAVSDVANRDGHAASAHEPGTCGGGPCGVAGMPSDGLGPVTIGVVPNPTDDGGQPGLCNGGPCGVVAMPPDAGAADARHGPCNGGPCGVVVMPPDAGAADAHYGLCNGGPCGVVVMPPDAGAADAHHGPCNGGPCGVVPIPPHDAGTLSDSDAGAPPIPCNTRVFGICIMPLDGG